MAFGNISTLYLPITASAGASQWGTDVRKLLNAADATADALTLLNHGTGGAVVRTADPYTTSAADSDQTLFGWAVTPSDMNSVSGAKRFYPAGNHVATIRMRHTAALAKDTTLTMYAYRVSNAAGGRARTLLGSASSAATSLPAVGGEATVTVTLALAEVIFEPDETIQYSFENNMAGTTLTGDTATFFTGTQTSVQSRIDTPTLGVLADTTGSSTGASTVDGISGKVLATEGASTGTGTASGVLGATASTEGSATGSSAISGVMSSVAGTIGTSAGSTGVAGILTGIGSMAGTSAGSSTVDGLLGAIGSMQGAAQGASTVDGSLGATGSMQGTSTGASSVDGLGSSVAGTVGNASGEGTAAGLASKVLGTVGTVEIGAAGSETITYIRPLFIFDD